MVSLLARERLAWVLALFYFLTFGGFVAFAIYLPTLLRDQFRLSAADAGFRTAGFVVLATLMRPVGGWLSDRLARQWSDLRRGRVAVSIAGFTLAGIAMLPGVLASNAAHKSFMARLVLAHAPKGTRILQIGLTFKLDTDDLRESPLVELAATLLEEG